MMDAGLIYGEPIKFDENIYIKVPTLGEVITFEKYNLYTSIFTITSREIFVTQRNVEELCERYPNIWTIAHDEQADMQVGSLFDKDKTVSMIIMEALSYWTGLNLESKKNDDGTNVEDSEGFVKMGNGKIVHIDSEWVIDAETFNRFADIIKTINCWTGENAIRAPRIRNDAEYESWMNHYRGQLRASGKNSVTIGDKILILSISANYIPVEEIRNMTIYTFEKMFKGFTSRDVYDKSYQLIVAGRSKTNNIKHWREEFINKTTSKKESK